MKIKIPIWKWTRRNCPTQVYGGQAGLCSRSIRRWLYIETNPCASCFELVIRIDQLYEQTEGVPVILTQQIQNLIG